MATIKMDVSEYETMKENKKLLENSLEKERELKDEIERLNKEKITALEEAKMKVVKVNKIIKEEYVCANKSDEDILRTLFNHLGLPIDYDVIQRYASAEYYKTHSTLSNLFDLFFTKHKATSSPQVETTTHGLDEIKGEIKEILKQEMDLETKNKLQKADSVISQNSELIKENRELNTNNISLSKSHDTLLDRYQNLNEQYEKLEEDLTKFNTIKEELDKNYNFWNKSKQIKTLKDIINK